MHEKGLEIFLMPNDMGQDEDIWKIPQTSKSEFDTKLAQSNRTSIELEPTQTESGQMIRNVAIEGDWHDIPSIKGMIKYDIKLAKKIVKERLPESEKGTYFAAKECFKKVLPQEYELIKELKDIITDRNAVRNI